MTNPISQKSKSDFIRYFLRLFRKDTGRGKNLFIKTMHNINRISIIIFILAIVVILVKYCDKGEQPQTITQIDLMTDSLENLFASALLSEHKKMETLEKMMDELEYVMLKPPVAQLKKIQQILKSMQKNLYSEADFYKKDKMLRYDSLTTLVVNLVQDLATELPNFKGYTRAFMFYKELIDADKRDLYLRRDYNLYAQKYNQFLKETYPKLVQANFFYGDRPQ